MKYRQRFENYIKRSYWFVGGYSSTYEGDNMYFDVENKCYTNRDTQYAFEIFCAGIRSQQQYKVKKNA